MNASSTGGPSQEAGRASLHVTRSSDTRKWSDFKVLVAFFAFFVAVENGLVIIWACTAYGGVGSPDSKGLMIWAMAMLFSSAASFVGGLIGFLFSIPRSNIMIEERIKTHGGINHDTITTTAASTTAGTNKQVPKLRVNTNLEEISDGLTKALLGIGLSQIHNLGNWTRATADFVGPSFGPDNAGKIVGMSVLAVGGLAGFFFVYLATRIFLTGAFLRAHPAQEQSGEVS